ncbi:hypothetical protein NE172_02165 [Clostridium botulinum]|uniref:Uncharacterized protein n=1 Tax=Clostridium botulinum TaxID=1491 RepID=A0A6B4JHX0_CLOBO|nr:hypothetical protein [Clostridium botulinum]EES49643.1 hypothetical protein CLO_0561 [Clostridium botulinum E1 str. 'BoNT E Beluga']MBY6759750.1 hypothetical protein [Clostridium botulinum]MBY6918659.1 hypothetical protein [Clostridium botulinum]MCR1129745.1 hypothetical protein [Clostridium botulinum]NFJ56467.1 hypothetical protein [Clostridium botulinum]
MAGIAKPNIDNLKSEGEVTFLESYRIVGTGSIKDLINNDIYDDNWYGCYMYGNTSWFTFEIFKKSNIYSYGIPYKGGSGKGIGEGVRIYKKVNDEFILFKDKIPTKIGEWYLLFEKLDKGVYKVMTLGDVIFTEWYVENLQNEKYLIKQNNQYYTIKPENYSNGKFTPLSLTGGDKPNASDYETYGFDDVNLLTQNMTVGTETFMPLDKFDKSKPLEIYKCIEK